jgi:hypothetical protein
MAWYIKYINISLVKEISLAVKYTLQIPKIYVNFERYFYSGAFDLVSGKL